MNYTGKRVFLTGHTGFKGQWLKTWLEHMGAYVTGYSLPDDVRDFDKLHAYMQRARPDIVFHLAAQAVVKDGYSAPIWTYQTNVMGTLHVLEACRRMDVPCVCITSDKVYAESVKDCTEDSLLQGRCPYSGSKVCAEEIAHDYREAFGVNVVTARAGNCIGGGDFDVYRLISNCIAWLRAEEPIEVNDPDATRPFQHALEPLHGYLMLGERLMHGLKTAPSWNFGPDEEWTVQRVVERVIYRWGGGEWKLAEKLPCREQKYLSVDSTKARVLLGWKPVWSTSQAIDKTVDWFCKEDPHKATLDDIRTFEQDRGVKEFEEALCG